MAPPLGHCARIGGADLGLLLSWLVGRATRRLGRATLWLVMLRLVGRLVRRDGAPAVLIGSAVNVLVHGRAGRQAKHLANLSDHALSLILGKTGERLDLGDSFSFSVFHVLLYVGF